MTNWPGAGVNSNTVKSFSKSSPMPSFHKSPLQPTANSIVATKSANLNVLVIKKQVYIPDILRVVQHYNYREAGLLTCSTYCAFPIARATSGKECNSIKRNSQQQVLFRIFTEFRFNLIGRAPHREPPTMQRYKKRVCPTNFGHTFCL